MLIALLLAVVFIVDPRTFEIPPFNEGVLLFIGATLMLLSWLGRSAARRAFEEPLSGPLVAAALWLLATVALSFLHDPWTMGLPGAAVLLVLILTALAAREHAHVHPLRLPTAMIATGAAVAIIAVAQARGVDPLFDNPGREPVSVFGNTNLVGQFLAPLIPLALVTHARAKGISFLIALVAIPLLVAGVVLSGSRAALLAAIAGVLFLKASGPLFGTDAPRALSLRAVGLAAAGAMLAIAAGGIGLLGFKTIADADSGIASLEYPTNKQRLLLAQATVDMIEEAPLLGHGPGRFRAAFPPYRDPDEAAIPTLGGVLSEAEDPHNQYLLLLAEGGLLTLLLFLAFALPTLLSIRQAGLLPAGDQGRAIAPGLAAAFASLLTVAMFRSILEHPPTALLFFLIAGGLLALRDSGTSRVGWSWPSLLSPVYLVAVALLGASLLGSNLCLGFASRQMEVAAQQRSLKELLAAERYMEYAETLDEDNVYALLARASLLDSLGRQSGEHAAGHAAEAAAVRRRALSFYPWHAPALIGLARHHFAGGRIADGESYLRRLRHHPLAPDPADPTTVAAFLRSTGGVDALGPYLLAKVSSRQVSLAELIDAADGALERGDERLARSCLYAVLELRPYEPTVAFKLAGTLTDIGESDEAKELHWRGHVGHALLALSTRDYGAARDNVDLALRRAPHRIESRVLDALTDAVNDDHAGMDQLLAEEDPEPLPEAFTRELRILAGDNSTLRDAIDALLGV